MSASDYISEADRLGERLKGAAEMLGALVIQMPTMLTPPQAALAVAQIEAAGKLAIEVGGRALQLAEGIRVSASGGDPE